MQLHETMVIAEAAGSLAAICTMINIALESDHADPWNALVDVRSEASNVLEKIRGLGGSDGHP
jgi:hypothetical protein